MKEKKEPEKSPSPRREDETDEEFLKRYEERSRKRLQELADADRGSLDRLRMSEPSPGIRGN